MLIKNGAKRVTLSLRQQWGSHHLLKSGSAGGFPYPRSPRVYSSKIDSKRGFNVIHWFTII